MRTLALLCTALLLSIGGASAESQGSTAKKYAPGQRQDQPGEAKKYAPGQKQKKPGQAKTYAPGQKGK
jgi:hypothetical protein